MRYGFPDELHLDRERVPETWGQSDAPEAAALRRRIGTLFRRAEGTMN